MTQTTKGEQPVEKGATRKLGRKEYEKELARLQGELVRLQEWVVSEGLKVCVVFEGRDTAGKGGVIKRVTERVSPRVFRVVALPKPTEREKGQMYLQRYVAHFPAAGEVVIFDRSWYNRAGVERVMGFCPDEEVFRFLTYASPRSTKSRAGQTVRAVTPGQVSIGSDERTTCMPAAAYRLNAASA
jgi:polyphosphate kinase